MAKFYGVIGYAVTREMAPDTWVDTIEEHSYYGDVLKITQKWENGESLNKDLTVNNRISIVADAFAYQHFFAIKYVKWNGVRWNVKSVEVGRPRLLLTIGGVYNGPYPEESPMFEP